MKHKFLIYTLLGTLCGSFAAADLFAAPQPAATVQDARKKAQEDAAMRRKELLQQRQEVQKAVRTCTGNRKLNYAGRIQLLLELLKDPVNAANPESRLYINETIIRLCLVPTWTQIKHYSPENAAKYLVPAAKQIIADPELKNSRKLFAYRALVMHCSDIKDFKTAETLAKEAVALPGLSGDDKVTPYTSLADVYRWNEDYENFRKTVFDGIRDIKVKFHPCQAKVAAHGAAIAMRYEKPDDAAAFWKESDTPFEELRFYHNYTPKRSTVRYIYTWGGSLVDRSADARAFVMDPQNPAPQRITISLLYCSETMEPQDVAARKTLADIPVKSRAAGLIGKQRLTEAFCRGDYALYADLADFFSGTTVMENPAFLKAHVVALGAIGKIDEAVKRAAEYSAAESTTAADKARYQFYTAILTGKSTEQILKNAKLTNKEEYAVLLSAARQCMVWGKMDLAEKYSAEYKKYFSVPELRTLKVVYSDVPVSFAEWRKMHDKLEKQYCNIPYKGALDFFETDVATGNRNVTFDPNANPMNTAEVSSMADRYGVHVFLRVEHENPRDVENGLAKAISPECYFAPGHNQPYSCFGYDPVAKSVWTFTTTYNNKNHQRLDKDNPEKSFKMDSQFTDNDYVLHFFFAWDPQYNKLPDNGSEWLFECIVWTPAGGMTWGGSQGPHAVSRWGRLKFELTRQQLNEIRKQIIFRTCKSYKMLPSDSGPSENMFICWADADVGDPAFYQKYLKPLQEKLEKYAAMVKKDMTDDEVEAIYINAIPEMKGLKYVIDELRRKYLEEALMND